MTQATLERTMVSARSASFGGPDYAYNYDNLIKINQSWTVSILIINYLIYSLLKIKNSFQIFKLYGLFFFIQVSKEIIWFLIIKKNGKAEQGVDTPHIYNIIHNYFHDRIKNNNEIYPDYLKPVLRLIMLIIILIYLLKTSNKTINLYLLVLNTALYYYNSWLPIGNKPLLIFLISLLSYRHYKEIKK